MLKRTTLFGFFSFFLVFAVWLSVSASGIVRAIFLPSPLAVLQDFFAFLSSGKLFVHTLASLGRILLGFVIATALALPLGTILAQSKKIHALLRPLIEFIRYTPIPAFIPLFILWFGVGEVEKVVVIFCSVFFQLVLMVAYSIRSVPQRYLFFSQVLGLKRIQHLWQVIFPYALPKIFQDLRINFGWAWSGLLIAEIVGASSGLGYIIIQSQRLLQTPLVIAMIIFIGFLGLFTDQLFTFLHNKFFFWEEQ